MSKQLVLLLSTFPQLSETFIVSKFLGLLDAGWDVHVVCERFSPAGWEAFESLKSRPGLRRRIHQAWPAKNKGLAAVLYLPLLAYALMRAPRRVVHYFNQGWKLYRWDILRRFYLDAAILLLSPDLVHIEFGALAVGRESLGRCTGSKLVVSFRGYDLNFSGLDRPGYYDQVWAYADGLHLLGSDLWQRAIRRGCPPAKAHVLIPPAVDGEFFTGARDVKHEENNGAQRPLRILSVGRLEWKKGYEYALQAVKALADGGTPCEYHIVGGGGYLAALAFARHQLGLEPVVQFLGSLLREQVRAQCEWADVFLHAAVSEGFCNAVIEAQAMQVPVVCTDADGLAENIADGVTGLLVPRRDVAAMARALARLAADEALRLKMGAAGRERVLEKFRLADQVDAFDRFYRQVLGEAR